ncbi:MAG: aspartate aminotransferase family protein, partial [Gammaproteobacteria bacterium]|nr:aspartate aminotransferase family protein [Gammaproteobacteria bacterium]
GNPVAMTAGLATLELISEAGFFEQLTDKTLSLVNGIKQAADDAGIALSYNQVGGMFGLFFSEEKTIQYFSQVMTCDSDRFNRFFHLMLNKGVYLAPSAFESAFVSSAHSEEDIQKTIDISAACFKSL